MDEITPVRKSRIISMFKKKRPDADIYHDQKGSRDHHENDEDESDENESSEDRNLHRKWYRNHPALLKKYVKKHVGRIKKAFFIDKKV